MNAHDASRTRRACRSPGHVTTARDLGILATRLMQDFPEYMPYYAIKKYRYAGHADGQRHQPQHAAVPRPDGRRPEDRPHRRGRLLPHRHGQARLSQPAGPPAAGDRAGREQRRRPRQRDAETAELGLHRLRGRSSCSTPTSRWCSRRVWKGTREDREARASPSRRAGRARRQQRAGSRPRWPGRTRSWRPIAKGQQVGTLKISVGDQPLRDVPLVALEAVEQAGMFGRAWDAIRLWIK